VHLVPNQTHTQALADSESIQSRNHSRNGQEGNKALLFI
jgi:hypothetical protein